MLSFKPLYFERSTVYDDLELLDSVNSLLEGADPSFARRTSETIRAAGVRYMACVHSARREFCCTPCTCSGWWGRAIRSLRQHFRSFVFADDWSKSQSLRWVMFCQFFDLCQVFAFERCTLNSAISRLCTEVLVLGVLNRASPLTWASGT